MRIGALLFAGALLLASPVGAQEWRLGAQVGQISYNGALATGEDQAALVLGLSRTGPGDWLGISAGPPLAGQEFWAAVAGLRRLALSRPLRLHVDLSGHAFAQQAPDSLRQPASGLPLGRAGSGPAGERWFVRGAGAQGALVFAAGVGGLQLEARAGAAARASYIAGERVAELLPMADARLLVDLGRVQLGPEAQQWREAVTYAGATARAAAGNALLWGSAGKWTRGGPGDLVWSLGGALDLGSVRLEGSYRSAGYDPLYQSETAGAASLGASVRVGGTRGVAAPVPASYRDGRAVIRLRARDVTGTPRIAGDFSDWKPVPMTREGGSWTATIALAPGVYNYAFVNERGEWFVPESVPGRRSDGMGGWQAVLVVE